MVLGVPAEFADHIHCFMGLRQLMSHQVTPHHSSRTTTSTPTEDVHGFGVGDVGIDAVQDRHHVSWADTHPSLIGTLSKVTSMPMEPAMAFI